MEGNLQEFQKIQKDTEREMRAGKYKDTLKTQFRVISLGSAWDSVRTVVGLKEELEGCTHHWHRN